MILVLDANILIRLVVGRRAPVDAANALLRGVRFATTAQLDESMRVLIKKFDFSEEDALTELVGVAEAVTIFDESRYADHEDDARCRLHDRAQPDWPVVGLAIAEKCGIWTDNRDFFGVGVPVWSSETIDCARSDVVATRGGHG